MSCNLLLQQNGSASSFLPFLGAPPIGTTSAKSVTATRLVRKLRGGSQSILVECDNRKQYVTKLVGNPQGDRVLFNEAFGAFLMQRLGLPCPAWRYVKVPQALLWSQGEYWFQDDAGAYLPKLRNVHFGSELVGGDTTFFQLLPSKWIDRIADRSLFLRALLLDTWAMNTDWRQGLFVPSVKGNGLLDVVFIDNGNMFGGPNWEMQGQLGKARFPLLDLYRDIWNPQVVSNCIEEIADISEQEMLAFISTLPRPWHAQSGQRAEVLCKRLRARVAGLPAAIEERRMQLDNCFKDKDAPRTSH